MPKGSEEQSDKQAHGAQQASLHPLSDVYFGRGQAILEERQRIKRKTIDQRRLLHRKAAA